MVERDLAKVDVAGPTPVSRWSTFMKSRAAPHVPSLFPGKAFLIISLSLAAVVGLFVLAGCKSLKDVYAPSSYSLDELQIDMFEAKTEVIKGYKGYAGRVIKVSPINGAKWNDYSRSIYWEWELEGNGFYLIEVSMSVLVESPNSGKPAISAYKPSQKAISIPSSIKWKGPGNIGFTVTADNDLYASFGGRPVNVPDGKWVDLKFSQAVDISDSSAGQIFLDGHSDNQGLVDLTLYIRDFRVTMTPTTKFIAMTFDGGPSDFTEFLVDKLDKLNVKGTFFMVGMGIDAQHPIFDRSIPADERASKAMDRRALLKMIHNGNHELGNLLYSHSSALRAPLSEAAIRKELLDNQTAIQKAVYGESDYLNHPWASRFCRIPSDIDASQITNLNRTALELELPIIGGNANVSRDSSQTPAQAAESIYQQINSWGIVVNQDPRLDPNILRVLDILIPRLQDEGYLFVTLSEMAELRGKAITPGNTYNSFDPVLP